MLNTFKGQDPSLQGSSECDFLSGCISALKNQSKEEFEKAYYQFKQTNNAVYDNWNKEILNRIFAKFQGNINHQIIVKQNAEDFIDENFNEKKEEKDENVNGNEFI